MAFDLRGRAALVTGAGRGIGRATALELSRRGAAILVNDIGASTSGEGSDAGPAREVVEEIEAGGGRAILDTHSVTDYRAVEDMVAAAEEAFGGVDILVNNAGLSSRKMIWEIDPELFGKVCSSHLTGTFNCIRAAVPQMRERGYGRIVNLVSRAGLCGIAGNAAYGAGKGGIFGLTNVVSRDLAPHGISVNAVSPSATDTRMVGEAIDAMKATADPEAEGMAEALQRALQRPEAVAVLIAALCSEEAGDISGEIFYVAGQEIGVFEPLKVTQKLCADEPWTSEAIVEALTDFEWHPLDTPYGRAQQTEGSSAAD